MISKRKLVYFLKLKK